jgi:hypothetical protein
MTDALSEANVRVLSVFGSLKMRRGRTGSLYHATAPAIKNESKDNPLTMMVNRRGRDQPIICDTRKDWRRNLSGLFTLLDR